MPTTRTYVIKTIKILVFFIALIVAFFLILGLFPDRIGVWTLLFVAEYKKQIGYCLLFLALCYFAYKIYALINNTDEPLQEFKRMAPAIVMMLGIVYAVSIFIYTNYDRTSCERHNYTERLNGGVKEINGKKYNIRICGDGGDERSADDRVQLEIFDEHGELLAKRHFIVHWDSSFHEPLEYHDSYILYYDFSTNNDIERRVHFPTSFVDWIRARLPLFN